MEREWMVCVFSLRRRYRRVCGCELRVNVGGGEMMCIKENVKWEAMWLLVWRSVFLCIG